MNTIDNKGLKTHMTNKPGFDNTYFVDNEAAENHSTFPYTFDTMHDFRLLDTQDGTHNIEISRQSILDTYIDAFKEANKTNPNVTDAEMTYIKGIIKTMFENNGSVNQNELDSLIEQLNLSKTTDIAKGSYTFYVFPDFEILDTEDGIDDGRITKKSVLNGYIDAFKKKNENDPNVTDAEMTHIKNTVNRIFEKNGYVGWYHLSDIISKLNQSKIKDIAGGSGSSRYTFNFDEKSEGYKADFEALDTFKNTKDNDKISKVAIMDYIDAFATEKNLTDNQIKNLKDKATNYYNSDKHISLSEFKKLTREMKAL
jgi:hypothetical protein